MVWQHAAKAQQGLLSTDVLCCGLEKNGMVGAWHGHGMENVNQTWPHCVNKMGKTNSKLLAARHGRGTAWARHGNGMLCVNRPLTSLFDDIAQILQSRCRVCQTNELYFTKLLLRGAKAPQP